MKAINRGVANARDWKPAENLPRVIDVLRDARRVLITMHRGPDGDALGSSLGLAVALREMGREVVHYNPDQLPYNLRFLPGSDAVVRTVPEGSFDAMVACDSGALHRLGSDLPTAERRGVTINLDHHLTTDPFGDINYVDPAAAAVGVLVFKIIAGLGHPLSANAAAGLYASILTDTGCFKYSSTDPECMRISAALLEAGVDPWEMASRIYESQPLARVKLLGEVLGTLATSPSGKFASILVARDMVARTGRTDDLTDGFINFARSIDGVEVAASFSEPLDGTDAWRISFRSRGTVNVAAVAQQFGGGGHHNAAGCTVKGDLTTVRAAIGAAVDAAL